MIEPDAYTPLADLLDALQPVGRLAEALKSLLDLLVDRPSLTVELLRIDCEVDAAAHAVKVRAAPQTPDGLDLLAAAVRARHADLLVVEDGLRHLISSLVGVRNAPGEAESAAGPRPAADEVPAGEGAQ